MKLETFDNYSATVVAIKNVTPLIGLDNLGATTIMGNQVLVGINTAPGTVGLFFPVETALSPDFLRANNLYNNATMNANPTVKGFFEASGRVKAVKFRLHRSEGFFIPLESLSYLGLQDEFKVGDEFNAIDGNVICQKYVKHQAGEPKPPKPPIQLPMVDGVKTVNLHYNTSPFYKANLPVGLHIAVTKKLHGTSGVCGKVLVNKGEYQPFATSRNDIRAVDGNEIWGHAARAVLPLIENGITLYYEIVGYMPSGAMVQPQYDYGYKKPSGAYQYGVHFGIYVYRVTQINPETLEIQEYTPDEVQAYCVTRGLMPVPHLFTGVLSDFGGTMDEAVDKLKATYLEQRCQLCKNDVPDEGIVIRVLELPTMAFKLKSFAFLHYETRLLDKGFSNEEL